MKQLILFCWLINLLNSAEAQPPNTPINTNPNSIDSAQVYLAGLYKKYNPQRAYLLYKLRADTGEAKAMNAIAIMYSKGIGVDSSISNAMYWYTKAIQAGYTKAIMNAGMLQKHIATDSVGYAKAVSYFTTAVQQQNTSAYFALGYMYYKGLGCTQSYIQAIDLFKQGILHKRADCMYFLGLCYKNGYGVTVNTDSSNKYIDLAAQHGYTQANSYFANSASGLQQRSANRGSNNSLSSIGVFQNEEKNNIKQLAYSYIPKSKTAITLMGSYKGLFTQYDYSGKQIKVQVPLEIQLFKQPNNIVTGNFYFNSSDKPIEVKAIQQGNQLLFSQTVISLDSKQLNKTAQGNTQLVFKNANLQQTVKDDTAYLQGTIQVYNSFTNETDKPVTINLKAKQVAQINEVKTTQESQVKLFPNPTKNTITLQFNLKEESALKVNVYDIKGGLVFTKIVSSLQKGSNSLTINPFSAGVFNGKMLAASAGIYTVTMQARGLQQTLTFIKE
jgi:TPR repeat protein